MHIQLPVQESNTFVNELRRSHTNGPVPNDVNIDLLFTQYKVAVLRNFSIGIAKPNNCIRIGHKIVLVENIIQSQPGVHIVYRAFRPSSAFFNYPIDSTKILVEKVAALHNRQQVSNIAETGKMVLLPYKDVHVAIPILHTC